MECEVVLISESGWWLEGDDLCKCALCLYDVVGTIHGNTIITVMIVYF